MLNDYYCFPQELKEKGHWVVRDNKVPYDPKTNRKANSADINTFADFETAYNCCINNNYSGIGIGIFYNLYAIDLDHCINDGVLSESAEIIVEAFASYTEISPSGDGLHIFGYINDFVFDKDKYYIHNQNQNIEVYIAGVTAKYVTVTGNRYNNYDISTCENSTMQTFLDNFMVREVKSNMLLPALPPVDTDIDFLSIGLEKDEKLKRYYNGERVLSDKSESENDLGFMSKLMYWCNNDTEKALAAFLSSPYVLQKDEKHKNKIQEKDYINGLLKKVLHERTAYTDSLVYDSKNLECKTESCKYVIFSATDLIQKDLPPVKYLVEDILPEGTTVIAAAPKSGKSWFVFDLGLKVASNGIFLDKKTTQTGVLYLALEDNEQRLQSRITKLLNGVEVPQNFYYSVDFPNLDNGFFKYVDEAISNNNNIKLIIIDTLQKIRGQALPRETPYQYDYREMGILKKYADKRGVSLLIVHHNRKMKDTVDPFNMISGTNGIMGAADTVFVMTKSQRDDEETNLYFTGRDVEGSSIIIRFDEDTCTWLNIGDLKELQEAEEKESFNSNNIVITVISLLYKSKTGVWQGKATDIKKEGELLHLKMPSPQKIGYELRNLKKSFKKYGNIEYTPVHSGNSSITHKFNMEKPIEPI